MCWILIHPQANKCIEMKNLVPARVQESMLSNMYLCMKKMSESMSLTLLSDDVTSLMWNNRKNLNVMNIIYHFSLDSVLIVLTSVG